MIRFLFTPGARSLKLTVRKIDLRKPATSFTLTSASTSALQISLTMPLNACETEWEILLLVENYRAYCKFFLEMGITFSLTVLDLVKSDTAELMRRPRSCRTMFGGGSGDGGGGGGGGGKR